jgi:hypothetical protein
MRRLVLISCFFLVLVGCSTVSKADLAKLKADLSASWALELRAQDSYLAKAEAFYQSYLGQINLIQTIEDQATSVSRVIPVGTIIASLTPPEIMDDTKNAKRLTLLQATWIFADGREVPDTGYAKTIQRFWPTGTPVSIPDLRGQFLRGVNYYNAGKDASFTERIGGDTNKGGSFQDDSLQQHWHVFMRASSKAGNGNTVEAGSSGGNLQGTQNIAVQSVIGSDAAKIFPRVSNETRPTNVAVYWYIKIN